MILLLFWPCIIHLYLMLANISRLNIRFTLHVSDRRDPARKPVCRPGLALGDELIARQRPRRPAKQTLAASTTSL